jgi:hypothetical protein
MILHASRYYHRLARFTYFLHDDATSFVGRINRFIDGGIPAHVTDHRSEKEEAGHDRRGCLCDLVVEDFFTTDKYGPLYATVHHLLRSFFHYKLNTTVLRWPASGEMIVPRESIRKHDKTVYDTILDSGIISHTNHHNNAHENCGIPVEEVKRTIGPIVFPRDPMDACASSLIYAHAFERSWLYIW